MPWEPAWVPDGRGGFIRRQRTTSEGEEGEEEPESPAVNAGGGSTDYTNGPILEKDDDDEEEGEISTPTGGGGSGGGSAMHRTLANAPPLDFRGGPAEPPSPRFGGSGRAPGQPMGSGSNPIRPSFGGGGPPLRHISGSSAGGGPPPFKREGSFTSRGGGGFGGPSARGADGPPPRDFGGDSRSSSSDFRSDGSAQGRDFIHSRGDFRNEASRGDFRQVESGHPKSFRGGPPGEAPPLSRGGDFRDHYDAPPPRGPGDYRDRNDGLPPRASADFRDRGEIPPSRGPSDYRDRGDIPPPRGPSDFRDRSDVPPPRGPSDFRDRNDVPPPRGPADFRDRGDIPPPRGPADFRDRGEAPPPRGSSDFRDRGDVPPPRGPSDFRDRGDLPLSRGPTDYRNQMGVGGVDGPAPRDGASFGSSLSGPLPRQPFRDGPPPRDIPPYRGSGLERSRSGSMSGSTASFGGNREIMRETTFSAMGRSLAEPNRETIGSGRLSDMPPREPGISTRPPGMSFGARGGPPGRDSAPPPQYRDVPNRETSFSDLAGPMPPRDRPFRDDRPTHRLDSQVPPAGNPVVYPHVPPAMPPAPALDPRRPTDPRRRSTQDLGAMAAAAPTAPPPLIPPKTDGPVASNLIDDPRNQPGPSPQHKRRVGSYSSLADNSTIPPSLMPSQPPVSHEGQGSFRSPIGRRNVLDPTVRSDRPELFGASGGMPRSSSWAQSNDRRQMSTSQPALSTSVGYQPPTQQSSSALPPMAPVLTSRPSTNFRDPRLQKASDPRGDASAPPVVAPLVQSLDEPIKKKSFASLTDPQVPESGQVMDGFGRDRTLHDKPFGSNPRSSPSKPHPVKTFHHSQPGDTSKPPSVSTTSSSEVATSFAEPSSTAQPEQLKPISLPPLLTSSLGQGEVVERAEKAVSHLGDIVGNPNLKATGNELSKLPAKPAIVSAVTEIEKRIKEMQKELDACVEEKKEAVEEEIAAEQLAKKKRQAAETARILKEEQAKEAEQLQEEVAKAAALQKAFQDGQDEIVQARQKLDSEFEEKVGQAKEDENRRFDAEFDSEVMQAEASYDKDISKARTAIEKAKSTLSKIEAKIAAAESEYQMLVETEEADGDLNQTRRDNAAPNTDNILIEKILSENKRRADESNVLAVSFFTDGHGGHFDEEGETSEGPKDPKYGKTFEEWSEIAKRVTGLADALYTEPSESPYYEHNERTNSLLAPTIKEYIRDKQTRLMKEWIVLAEEYEVRKRLYEKQQRKLAKKAQRGGSVSVQKKSILAGNVESPGPQMGVERGNVSESGGRTSNNPYRRARRGNEVRSEYEQEQIIAEIAAKEAMERRITHGGCTIPRQVSRLERRLTANYVQTFTAKLVDDPLLEAKEAESANVWSDMEKSIYLDRFLQFPKDFRRIASFLRNKTTKDCIAFYYDSKQMVPYKGALKEHMMRRKRKGEYQIWDASIQAALSVGATVTAGSGEDKPVNFSLPESDKSYRTYLLHPLKRSVLDNMVIDEEAAQAADEEGLSEDAKWKSRKRGREPLFFLEKEHTKYLRMASQESMSSSARVKIAPPEPPERKTPPPVEAPVTEELPSSSAPATPMRKAPQKWTPAEKKIFVETLEKYGRDWKKLAEAVGNKSDKQIKNFYYDWKKGKSRAPTDKKESKKEKAMKSGSETSKKPQGVSGEEIPGRVVASEVSGTDPINDREDSRSPENQTPKKAEQDEQFDHAAALAELRAQAEALTKGQQETAAQALQQRNDILDSLSQEGGDYSRELIQQLLNHQLQQQQQLGQHIQLGQQQPQSAIQQLLSQQHLQREQQQQQQLSQLSLEDARRLLDHHQNQRGSVLSSLMSSPWMAPFQSQGGLPSHSIAGALRGEGNSLGSLADMNDLQRLLQMQQASQSMGIPNRTSHLNSMMLGGNSMGSSSNTTGIPASLLSQIEALGNGNNSSSSDSAVDHLSTLANAQSLLGGFGGNSGGNSGLANALFRQAQGGGMDTVGVSDALSLLARSMQQRGDGSNHGFGRMPDR